MTAYSPARTPRPGEPDDWVAALREGSPQRDAALTALHALLLRAAGHQAWRMRGLLADSSPGTMDDLVNQCADDAMTTLLGKLDDFEGRSRFTTWAFKFAVYQMNATVRQQQWRHRVVELRELPVAEDPAHSPEEHAVAKDLASALADAMHEVLTPHQRHVAVALLVDEVPIDVLAERLGSTRGALYKTIHTVRTRLRDRLESLGHDIPQRSRA